MLYNVALMVSSESDGAKEGTQGHNPGVGLTFSPHPLLISPFPTRLVDAFKLQEQLNVPVQKLPGGTARKVRVCRGLPGGWRAEAGTAPCLCLAAVFCAEPAGRPARPASG